MPDQTADPNDLLNLREMLPRWIAPALDILAFQMSYAPMLVGLQSLDRSQLRQMVAAMINRIDPHKAPEQYADEATVIAAFLLPYLKRVTAQRDPTAYVVGFEHNGPILEFDPANVDPFSEGSRTRPYATLGEAQAFAAECGPQSPTTEFTVYALRAVSGE